MSEDQFTKLYKYMQEMRQEFREELQYEIRAIRVDVHKIYGLLDQEVKNRQADEQERAAMAHKIDRRDGWIKQLAKTTHTKLVPD